MIRGLQVGYHDREGLCRRLAASGRMSAWSRTALAANVRHDSRVHLIAPLPSLIHCSHVPRVLALSKAARLEETLIKKRAVLNGCPFAFLHMFVRLGCRQRAQDLPRL